MKKTCENCATASTCKFVLHDEDEVRGYCNHWNLPLSTRDCDTCAYYNAENPGGGADEDEAACNTCYPSSWLLSEALWEVEEQQ